MLVKATIQRRPVDFDRFDQWGNIRLVNGEAYAFRELGCPISDLQAGRLLEVATLGLEVARLGGNGQKWYLNAIPLDSPSWQVAADNEQKRPLRALREKLTQLAPHQQEHIRAVMWLAGRDANGGWDSPVFLTDFHAIDGARLRDQELTENIARLQQPLLNAIAKFEAAQQSQTTTTGPARVQPPEINEALIWQVEQMIRDELDAGIHSAPSASQVFIEYCRDRRQLVAMVKRHPHWKYRTLKKRKQMLEAFLYKKFRLTLDSFFVDARMFAGAEKMVKEYKAKRISPHNIGECSAEEPSD